MAQKKLSDVSVGSLSTLLNADLLAVHQISTDLLKKMTAANFLSSSQAVYNAKYFGLDATGATDNTALAETAYAAVSAAGGGKLIFTPGTYRFNGIAEILAGNIIIELVEGATIILGATDACPFFIGDGGTATVAVDNVAIMGRGKVDINGQLNNARAIRGYGPLSNILVQGIEITGAGATEVIFIGGLATVNRCTNVRVDSVNIHDCASGITLDWTNNGAIVNSTIENLTTQDAYEIGHMNGGLIMGNYCRNPSGVTVGAGNSGIDVFGTCTDIGVVGNVVLMDRVHSTATGMYGIAVEANSGAERPQRVLIANNLISGVVPGTQVTSNQSWDYGVKIIHGYDVDIVDNKIRGCLYTSNSAGIHLASVGASNIDEVQIRNNSIDSVQRCILDDCGARLNIRENRFRNYSFTSTTAPIAFNATAPSNHEIHDNVFSSTLATKNNLALIAPAGGQTAGAAWGISGNVADAACLAVSGLPVLSTANNPNSNHRYGFNRWTNQAGTDWLTQTYGTAMITAAAAFVDVTHGLAFAPSINQIQVTARNNIVGAWWMPSSTSTTFRIQVASAQAGDVSFSWAIVNKG